MFELDNSYPDLTLKQLLEKSAKPAKGLFQAKLKEISRKENKSLFNLRTMLYLDNLYSPKQKVLKKL